LELIGRERVVVVSLQTQDHRTVHPQLHAVTKKLASSIESNAALLPKMRALSSVGKVRVSLPLA
jgi:hypothetical protein